MSDRGPMPEPPGARTRHHWHQKIRREWVRSHAPSRADLPVDEIVKVTDTVIVRPDPALIAT